MWHVGHDDVTNVEAGVGRKQHAIVPQRLVAARVAIVAHAPADVGAAAAECKGGCRDLDYGQVRERALQREGRAEVVIGARIGFDRFLVGVGAQREEHRPLGDERVARRCLYSSRRDAGRRCAGSCQQGCRRHCR